MKRFILALSLIAIFSLNTNAQILVDTFPFEWTTQLNSFWGITKIDNTLQVGADGNGDIYQVSPVTGQILGTLTTDATVDFNHGMIWDGTAYWVAEDFSTGGATLKKINAGGNVTDEVELPPIIGGNSSGIGGLTMDGGQVWYSVYYPDFDDYPFNYAYKIDLSTEQITDTIPLYGQQVYGLAAKGDTIFYVTDDLDGDEERIYAYSKMLGDTLFSWPLLDPDGDSSPRGLHWDGDHLWLVAKRPGSSAFAYSMLYKYEIGEPTPTPQPQMSLSQSILNFNEVFIGESFSLNFLLKNIGDAELTVSDGNFDNPVFTFEMPPAFPLNIAPDDSLSIDVQFTPTAITNYNGLLTLISNGNNNPIQTVELIGSGNNIIATHELSQMNLSIFPNPAKGFLNVRSDEQQLIKQLRLINALGQEVFRDNNKTLSKDISYTIDLEELVPGLYFLRIENASGQKGTSRIILQQ